MPVFVSAMARILASMYLSRFFLFHMVAVSGHAGNVISTLKPCRAECGNSLFMPYAKMTLTIFIYIILTLSSTLSSTISSPKNQ